MLKKVLMIFSFFLFLAAKLMRVGQRQAGYLTLKKSLPVSNTLPKKIADMSSYEDCAVWCYTFVNCVFFEHIPNTNQNDEGVCTIRFN